MNISYQYHSGTDMFEGDELQLLDEIGPSLEGRTEQSKNKNKPQTLSHCLWVIDRLGNWKPQDKSPPGPITFRRGWQQLQAYHSIENLRPKNG